MRSASQTILFVDDEPNVLSSLLRLLRREGWQLRTANSASEALELLAGEPVDVVVSDMRMPEMDGAAFLQHVKERYPRAVRILLTGYSERDAVTRAFNDGDVHDLITKPWDDDELKAILRGALDQVETQGNRIEGLGEIINTVDVLPPLPRAYAEIRRVIDSADDTSTEAVAEVILREPAITARLLQVANSSCFGQRQQVDTLNRALVVLGMAMVEELVLMAGVFDAFGELQLEQLPLAELWRHSVACGVVARRLEEGRTTDRGRHEEAMVAGLLHDMGKLLLAWQLPDRYGRLLDSAAQGHASLSAAEEAQFGASHALVGAYLARWWHLPDGLVETIQAHHAPERAPGELAGIIHLADIVAHQAGIGASGISTLPEVSVEVSSRLGVDAKQLGEMALELRGQAEAGDPLFA